MNRSRRRLLIFGSFYFIAYFIAAIVLYKERIFLDGVYYFFHVVQSESFWVEHQRFILVPSQFLAWAGVNLHLPLNSVLLLNSINPVSYLLILFLLSVFLLKDEPASWGLLLLGVCGIYFLYFCPMYEVWYGSLLLIFFSALLNRRYYQEWWELLILVLTSITLLFSYPLMVIGFIFFSLYHFLDIKKIPLKPALTCFACLILWILCKYFFISDYESGKITYPWSQMKEIAKNNFGSISNIWSLTWFLFSVYTEEVIAFVLVVIVLFSRKKYAKAVLIICTVGGFVLLINLTQDHPWIHSNYYERIYLLLVPLCFIPFLRELYYPSGIKILFELLFALVIFSRGFQIIRHSSFYTDRIDVIEHFAEQAKDQGGSKFFIEEKNYPGNAVINEWSFPMEILVFSSLKRDEYSTVISLKPDLAQDDVRLYLNESTFLLRLNEVISDDGLNRKYFEIQHGLYRELYLK